MTWFMESTGSVDAVVKVGGRALADRRLCDRVMRAVRAAAAGRRLLVVPGGGPLADAVRLIDRTHEPSVDAAHWMAVLAMDQWAHLVSERLERGAVVDGPRAIARALDSGRIPVLAPARWLQDSDPLPHGWEVTADSIAAWAAGVTGAERLVLIKPPKAAPPFVDAYFGRAVPSGVAWRIVMADHVEALAEAVAGPESARRARTRSATT